MKKASLAVFILLVFAAVTNSQNKFGLGIIVGEPTGLSGKLILSDNSAVDGALGWSFYKYGSIHIHGDYLYNFTRIIPEVPLYIGVGGRIKMKNTDEDEDDVRLAVRVPVGIAYEPSSAPVDVFLELVPMLDLVPASDFSFNAAIGVRYWF
ncbi:MAG: DUF3996 domain-containing protein [Ignavibacteria bacterium]|jgi:hypothetical protein|nr:DUF3996 domain-containing protein [Ignavibacteria bacterium]